MTEQGNHPGRLAVTWLPSADDAALLNAAAAFMEIAAEGIRVVRACRACGSNRHGKPVLVDANGRLPIHVSLSRTHGLAVVAVTDAGPVGVDVERMTSGVDRDVDIATWVRKESVVKATGHGLLVDPSTIEVTSAGQPPALVTWPAEPITPATWMFDLATRPGYVGAATVLCAARPVLVERTAGRAG